MSDELYVLGSDAVLYVGDSGANLASLTEIDNVQDLTLTMDSETTSIRTRRSGAWSADVATVKNCEVSFKMQWAPGDTGFATMRDAFLNSTLIRMAPLSAARDVSGAEGPLGEFSISGFSRSEPLGETQTVDVTAKLSQFVEWVGAS